MRGATIINLDGWGSPIVFRTGQTKKKDEYGFINHGEVDLFSHFNESSVVVALDGFNDCWECTLIDLRSSFSFRD